MMTFTPKEIEDAALILIVTEGGAVKWSATHSSTEVAEALIQIAEGIITEEEAKHG